MIAAVCLKRSMVSVCTRNSEPVASDAGWTGFKQDRAPLVMRCLGCSGDCAVAWGLALGALNVHPDGLRRSPVLGLTFSESTTSEEASLRWSDAESEDDELDDDDSTGAAMKRMTLPRTTAWSRQRFYSLSDSPHKLVWYDTSSFQNTQRYSLTWKKKKEREDTQIFQPVHTTAWSPTSISFFRYLTMMAAHCRHTRGTGVVIGAASHSLQDDDVAAHHC